MRIAITIFVLEAILVGGVLFVSLRHSLTTTKVELGDVDHDTTALLQDLGRIALLTDEFGNLQSFIEKLDQRSRISSVSVDRPFGPDHGVERPQADRRTAWRS